MKKERTKHMAYLRKKPNSKYWIACWGNAQGKRVERSTKIEIDPTPDTRGFRKSPAENQIIAQKIADAYEAAEKGQKTMIQLHSVLEEISKSVETVINIPTIDEWFEKVISIKTTQNSESSVNQYKTAYKLFRKTFPEDVKLSTITKSHLYDFRDTHLINVRPNTVKKHLSCLKAYFALAVQREILTKNPVEGVTIPQTVVLMDDKIKKKAFTKDQIRTLLEKLPEEWKSMVICSLYTGGQRLGDIATLKWENINLDKKTIFLRTQKRKIPIELPLAPPLLKHLRKRRALIPDQTHVHPYAAKSYARSQSRGLSTQFGNFLRAYGMISDTTEILEGNRRDMKDLSFHSLRSSAITMMRLAGVPEIITTQLVGQSKEVQRIYNRPSDQEMLESLKYLDL